MKRPRVTREVLRGLRRMAAVTALAQTHALHQDVQTALKWIEKLNEEEACKTTDERA